MKKYHNDEKNTFVQTERAIRIYIDQITRAATIIFAQIYTKYHTGHVVWGWPDKQLLAQTYENSTKYLTSAFVNLWKEIRTTPLQTWFTKSLTELIKH